MKSHSCTNHTPSGHGSTDFSRLDPSVPAALAESRDQLPAETEATSSSRPARGAFNPAFRYCAHVTAAGRHCRMLALVDSELCDHHYRVQAKRLQKKAAADKTLADLLGHVPTFQDPATVHHFIGDVIKQFAEKRISRPDALALGYLCQLLLTSFADRRKWLAHSR